MSNSIYAAKAGGLAFKNDALRDAFALDGVRCFLLKRDRQSKFHTPISEILNGWRIKFDDHRAESGLLRVATADIAEFRDIWASASHIGYGVPDDLGKIEVYGFAKTADGIEKDAIDPDGSSVYFAGRIIRESNERFTIPDYLFDLDGDYLTDGDGFRIFA